MNIQTETNTVTKVAEEAREIEYPLQERHCVQVIESAEVAAEAVFTARRFEVREEAGLGFVP